MFATRKVDIQRKGKMSTEFEQNKTASRTVEWLGPFCFIAALVLYLATLSSGAYPGVSAKTVADYTGISPFMPLLHPLYWGFAQLLNAIPTGSAAAKLNIFSALCGALDVWLVYEIIRRIKHNRTTEERRASVNRDWARRASGLVGAAFLATAIPFWMVSTRAHTAAFDMLIVLFLVRQLQKYQEDGRVFRFYIVTLGVGLGLAEFPTMLLLALPFLVALFYQMWIKEMFVKKRKKQRSPFWMWFLRAIGMMAIGVLPILIIAWIYKSTPAYDWRDFSSFFKLLIHVARRYFQELGGSTNQIGWLLVSLVSFVPCIAVLVQKKEQGRDKILGSYFFHLVLAAIGIVIIFNIHVSPWALYGNTLLLVTPYLFMAVWIGYVSGYWFTLFFQRHWGRSQGPVSRSLQKVGTWMLLPLYMAIIVAAVVLNLPVCDGGNAAPVQRLAQDVAENMGEKEWLISNGIMDDMIQLAAESNGLEISLINPRLGASKAYLRYLSTKLESPRMKGLALLGLSPLLKEWFSEHPAYVEEKVAVLANPDIWLASGYSAVPTGILYAGTQKEDISSLLIDISKAENLWKPYLKDSEERDSWPKPIAPRNRLALRHISKNANNLGFAYQEAGKEKDAIQAYKTAFKVENKNVSALLNIASLADETELADSDKWHDELEAQVDDVGRKLNSWNLSYQYGYVYEPMTYVNRGLVWAMSGKPNLGISEIERAIALGGHGEHLKVLLAGMYFMQEEATKSEDIYLEILKDNPESIKAIRGLLRINVRRGNFDIARGYINRLEEVGYDPVETRIEEAILESIAGDKEQAKELLKDILKEEPDSLKAWTMLALIAVEQNDRDLQEKCLKQFRKRDKKIPRTLLMAMAQVALTQRETSVARKYIEQLLDRYPQNEELLEWQLRIDVYEFNREAARKSVEKLMAVNPKNGFANYILGTLHIYREQYALAEPPLRVSVEQKRDVKRLNTLAYTLYVREKDEEAMKLVKEAFEIDDRHGPAWDTYAMLLYRKGEYDKAMKAIQRAIDFMPEHPEVQFHLAQLYEKQGEYQKARDILEELLLHPSRYSLTIYENAREMANRIRDKSQY